LHERAGNGIEAEGNRTGCLSTLGLAIGTYVVSFVLVLPATMVINSLPASRVGELMGIVLPLHLVGFAISRGRIRHGAQLLRVAGIVVAIEVGLVVLVLLLAALTPG
jgi:hypothetical protein